MFGRCSSLVFMVPGGPGTPYAGPLNRKLSSKQSLSNQGKLNTPLAFWIFGVVHVLSLKFGKSDRAPLILCCPLLSALPFFTLPSIPFIVSCKGHSTLFHSSAICCAIWPHFGARKQWLFFFRPNRQQFAVKIPSGQTLLINTFAKVTTCVMNSIIFESIIRMRGSLFVINQSHYKGEVRLWPSYFYHGSTLFDPRLYHEYNNKFMGYLLF